MRLHEYQSKSLFAKHGLPVPEGHVAATPEEARQFAEELGGTVAVKAQVLIGGRGKAGGIRLAHTPAEAEEIAAALLGLDIRGFPVRELLVEQAVDIAQEIYLGIALDRALRRMVMMASAEGGVEIEQVAHERPAAIHKAAIDPLGGLTGDQTLALAVGIGLPDALHPTFDRLARGLYEVLTAHDALLAEINPLVITGAGDLLALDGKMVIDDNALFRHPDLSELRADATPGDETPAEREAREAGLSYVHLGGDIGCVVNGAGLAMATMDVIQLFGGVPANFLDVGGGAGPERVATALRLVLGTAGIKAVLINIFGGITLCDEVAQGIVAALDFVQGLDFIQVRAGLPIVVRLVGTNEERGHEILNASGHRLIVTRTLAEAARTVVAVSAAEGER
jgi:succinyl-CoA synthetase beta subunit